MQKIVLTEEQSRILANATDPVEVCDAQGRLLTRIVPLSEEERAVVERFRQRSPLEKGQQIPSEQVQAHLRRLQAIRDREGMDEAKMLDLLRRMQQGEQV